MAQSPEFALIQRHFARLGAARRDVTLGVGDDCALLTPPPGQQLAVSMDLLLAGRHFPHDTPAHAVGHKALAVNLSDLAAMGAEPAWVTLGLSLPEVDDHWLEGFAKGFAALAEQHEVALVGGDTVRGPLAISVQVHGFVELGAALRRDRARPGDALYVSGWPGEAAAALPHRLRGERGGAGSALTHCSARLDYPTPRVGLGHALRGVASAAIDLSDGLHGDLGHILEQSHCGATLELEALPLSTQLIALTGSVEAARTTLLRGGDDYELLFCVPPRNEEEVHWLAERLRLPLHRIGTLEPQSGLRLRGADGQIHSAEGGSFDHFSH